MISQKSKYALKAMTVLAQEYGKGPTLVAEIASREQIPRGFLELILLELKNRGWLASRKGRRGGYFLVKPPADISVGELLRAIDGPLAPLPCVSKTAYRRCEECVDERTCCVRLLMRDVREATVLILDHTTIADILRRSERAAARDDTLHFSI